MLKEFKPTILFLVKFLGIYVAGNLMYGWYINAWLPQADSATSWVSIQTAWIIRQFGYDAQAWEYPSNVMVYLQLKNTAVLSIYEGCNGLNVAIVFIAFVFALGPYIKKMIWFVPLGLLIIHLANLARLVMLFFVSLLKPDLMYFTHKYLFTAFIYLFVFLLWIWWVVRLARTKPSQNESTQ